MKRWVSILLAVIVMAALFPLAGCSEAKATYKIGAVFAATGFNSALGMPEKQTIEMLVAEINKNGGINGHKLEVIIRDTESQEVKCVSMVNDLIEQGVLAIIGPTSSGESMAILDTMTTNKVPLISCAASAKIVEPVSERYWIFKTPQSDVLAVRELFDYWESQNMKKIAMITDTGGYGTAGKAALEAELSNHPGFEIVASQTFGTDSTDMTAQVTVLKNSGADCIICWGTNPGPSIIAQNMQTLNVDVPYFCSHGVANRAFIDLGGSAVNGAIFPAGKLLICDQLPDSDPQKAVLTSYKADFEAAYGAGKANTFGGHAYDALMMLVEALDGMPDELSTADARAHIRGELEKIKNFAGTGGIFNMSASDHNGLTAGCFVMIKVVDGEWTWLQ